MIDICTKIVSVLKADSTLTATVPANNISVGPLDVTQETAASHVMPQINIRPISESVRTVPLTARDTRVQLDIWSKNSELEVQTIYERVIQLLDYLGPYDQGTSHIFWQRLGGASSSYETSNRLWHYSQDFMFWGLTS